MLIFKLTREVYPCARGSVNVVKSWKILGSSSVIRLLPTVRHLATQRDNSTRFEKVDKAISDVTSTAEQTLNIVQHFSVFIFQENIFTVPNVLSLGRIVLSPALGYFVLSENYKLALMFFVLAGVSDMVGTKYILSYKCIKVNCIILRVFCSR